MQVFDPRQEYKIVERRLPHWSQPGTLCFITWRTWDSMPVHVIETWLAERAAWLRRQGIDSTRADWQESLKRLPAELAAEFQAYVSDRWHEQLDGLHGACVLRDPALAKVVDESLRHFDGSRYELTDFVVLPNHVHLLAVFPDEDAMPQQCESWKYFTARRINGALGRKGRFWQQDSFDHLVRSAEQFQYLRGYVADNPRRARLASDEYVHYSKPFGE